MSQPTTCFGLFYLGHLQVGYLSQRKIYNNTNYAYIFTNSLYTRPIFVNEISSLPPPTSMVVLHTCTFPLTKVSNLKMA